MSRPEERLLILACLEPLAVEEAGEFAAIASDPGLDWGLVGALAALNKVEPRLSRVLRLRDLWDRVPEAAAAALAGVAEQVGATNGLRVLRAVEVLSAFREANIPVCVLKGVLFAETLYGDPAYKRMNDVDMLVHPEDASKIIAIYEGLGYFSIAERVAKRPDLNRRVSHHLPPYASRTLDCLLGTQWGLKSPRAGLKIDYAAIWGRVEPFDYHGVPARKMSSRDNLFHVCVHLGVFKSGLRDLMDIANLIRQESERIDWAAFIADVQVSGAQSLVVHALTMVQCIDPRPDTRAVLDALMPDARGFYLAAAARKARSVAVLLRICSGHLSTVEKNVSAFNVAGYFPQKASLFVAFWRSVLAAPTPDRDRICFEPAPTRGQAARARIVAPVQILRAIGAEVGSGLVAALLVKSVVDLAVSFVRWPFVPRSRDDLDAYARSLGLTLADLKRVEDAIY